MPTADYSSYHQPNATTSDGSKFDNFIDAVQATVNGLDNNNIAAAAGIVASKLADPTSGKVLGSSGGACAAVYPPGYELAYDQFTSAVSITATTEGTADIVKTATSVTFDGSPVIIEFFSPGVIPNTGFNLSIIIRDDTAGTIVGRISSSSSGSSLAVPVLARRRLTPAAGARVYSVRAFTVGGTGSVGAGAGGSGADVPGFIRITKV